jgi:hypothetical protein
MNTRLVNVILLGLTLALVGVIGLLIHLLRTAPLPTQYLSDTKIVTNTVTQIAVRKVNATNLLAALASRNLSWAVLESTNYFVYVNNLRQFGAPEETIRDIILTDVAKLYSRRRAALLEQVRPPNFWETGTAWENGPSRDPAVRAQLRALEEEQRDLIRQLLGVDYKVELAKLAGGDDETFRKYGFLPPGKREQMVALQEKYDALEADIYARTKGFMLEEEQEQLRDLQKQREDEMAQTLTPDEMEEYQLRESPTAQSLRFQLTGFTPTEEEFRKIFRLQKVFDEQFSTGLDAADDAQIEARSRAQADAQEALNEEIRKTVGDKRFTDYQRAQDNDYKSLVQLTERYAMPQEMANRVFDMKAEAERQKLAIESNPGLTDDQRQAALNAVAQETERSVSQALGDKVFRSYRRVAGQWINGLMTLPEPAVVAPEVTQ